MDTVLLTVTFLVGAIAGALAVFLGFRSSRQEVATKKRARKPRPPRCYVVEPTTFEEKPRPRKPRHQSVEDEAPGPVEPTRGVDIAV